MKKLFSSKLGFSLCVVLLLFVLYTNSPALANDNIYDCIENQEGCLEDQEPNAETDSGEEVSTRKTGISVWEYIKTGFALVFVIGLLFTLLKFINRKNRLYDKNKLMKNMGGISLGQQKSVQLIVVGERYYLVGVGDDIRLLKEITDSDEIDRLIAYYDNADVNSTLGWLDRLVNWISERRKQNSSHSNSESTDFSNLFNTRLDEMKEDRKRQVSRLTEKERNQDE